MSNYHALPQVPSSRPIGTNIEAPVSEIEAAVARGMQKYIGTGGGQQTVILEVDKKVLGRVTYQANKEENRRIGVNLVGV